MKKVLVVLMGAITLAAVVLGAVAFTKASSGTSATSALRSQVASLRSEVAAVRFEARQTKLALAMARSELAVVGTEAAKTSKGTKLGYCVEYFDPQDGNVVSYNTVTGNDDYTDVYSLIADLSTPQLVNGVWQCTGGGTFVPLAQ